MLEVALYLVIYMSIKYKYYFVDTVKYTLGINGNTVRFK